MRLSRQRGGAWAHDCAVWDEEVAEDQDESGGHCGWWCVAVVASFLNGILSEVESVCVCLQRGVVWALVVVELVCEVQCVERWRRKDCRRRLLTRDYCLSLLSSSSPAVVGSEAVQRRYRLLRPRNTTRKAAYAPGGGGVLESDIVVVAFACVQLPKHRLISPSPAPV